LIVENAMFIACMKNAMILNLYLKNLTNNFKVI